MQSPYLSRGSLSKGKTTTARHFSASEVRLDRDQAMLAAAQVDADLVLDGVTPRLIDEYQLVPEIWNAVSGRADDVGEKGMFILTGSATPEGEPERHTGARRIAMLQMGTLSFQERGLSTGTTSLAALLAGGVQASGRCAARYRRRQGAPSWLRPECSYRRVLTCHRRYGRGPFVEHGPRVSCRAEAPVLDRRPAGLGT